MEYRVVRDAPLTPAEARELRAALPSATIAPSWGGPGFDVTPGSEIGFIALASTDVVIKPKVPIDRVLFMVSYALDPVRWQQRHAAYESSDTLVEAMAALYLHGLHQALRRGVLQGYRTREEALSTVRGRILFEEQLRRRFGRNLPVEVRYDDFTADTELNRLLYAAVRAIARLPLRAKRTRALLVATRSMLAEQVAAVDIDPDRFTPPTWTRLNDRFRVPAELARLVLRSTALDLDVDKMRGSGLVVDMNVVFEEFVRTAIREALGANAVSFPSGEYVRLHLDERRRIRLKPDLSWWVGGRCVFVGDAKYKRVAASGVRHPDVYQLLAYMTALGLESGVLIYAAGEAAVDEHTVSATGHLLRIDTVDLDFPPVEVLQQITAIAGRLRLGAQRQAAVTA